MMYCPLVICLKMSCTCKLSQTLDHFGGLLLACKNILTGNDIVPSRRTSRSCFVTQSEVVMEGTALLQLPEGMRLDQIQITENALVIQIFPPSPTPPCPLSP